ncbi:hypothetical protein Tco_0386488 [Tanacetum coccineum]
MSRQMRTESVDRTVGRAGRRRGEGEAIVIQMIQIQTVLKTRLEGIRGRVRAKSRAKGQLCLLIQMPVGAEDSQENFDDAVSVSQISVFCK